MTGPDPHTEHLPDDIAALLADSTEASAPIDVRQRVLARVQASVGGPGVGSGAEVVGAGAQGFGVAAALLGVVLVVGAVLRPGQGPPVSEVVPGVTLVQGKNAPTARGVRQAATPMKAAPSPTVATSPLIHTPSPAEPPALPIVASPPAKRASPLPKAKRAERKAAASNLAVERELLDRARASLRSRDGAGALKLVRSHRKRYPRGALVEERESLWVRALLEGGQRGAGTQRAERFLKRFPRSIHRASVERALERARR